MSTRENLEYKIFHVDEKVVWLNRQPTGGEIQQIVSEYGLNDFEISIEAPPKDAFLMGLAADYKIIFRRTA